MPQTTEAYLTETLQLLQWHCSQINFDSTRIDDYRRALYDIQAALRETFAHCAIPTGA